MPYLQTRERKSVTSPTTRLIHAQPAVARRMARYAAMPDMEPTIRGIEVSLLTEFACMSRILRRSSRSKQLEEIHKLLDAALEEIQGLIIQGEIQPWRYLRLSRNELEPEAGADTIRIGVYPACGNPLHWGDLLSGLTVMAKAKLDKVVYAISDDGEKEENLLPEGIRHAAAKDILGVFEPLLVYSGISRGSRFDPIKDIALLHELNPGQKLDIYYVVCSGHRLAGQDVSSTRIREALRGAHDPEVLSALPYSVFRHMAGGGAYQTTANENVHSKGQIENGFIENGLIEKGVI